MIAEGDANIHLERVGLLDKGDALAGYELTHLGSDLLVNCGCAIFGLDDDLLKH